MKEETVPALFKWTLVRTDPSPYKKYAPELEPQSILISVDIPASEVVHWAGFSEGELKLTPRGMALAMKELSNAIARVEGE